MQKKFLPAIVFLFNISIVWSQNNNRLFDQPTKLKSFSINIQCDAFIATTLIEIEFYNPNDKEVEGLYRFHLDSGQAITGFQLELNGKYREGSIEEKWKARSAYNSIVGKRMDPALLQCEYNNNYRLNIFPVPAGGSRKITITIQQLLSSEKNELFYRLPFTGHDTATHFEMNIRVNNLYGLPVIKKGLLIGKSFNHDVNESSLNWITEKLLLSGEISFMIPLQSTNAIHCSKTVDQKNYYALRINPQIPTEFDVHPKKMAVYWDASASANKRNLKKEINFLRQYISYYGISQLTIIPFNYAVVDTARFYFENNNFNSRWERYLQSLNYDGATQFGCLDFSSINADIIFLFSDGENSYGKSLPNTGAALVYCINSATGGNVLKLQEIAAYNGGRCIDLNKLALSEAIRQSGKAQNWLLRITSINGITCDQLFPIPIDKNILLNGILYNPQDTLTLYYGHGDVVSKTQNIYLKQEDDCAGSTVEKISMLNKFAMIQKTYLWDDALEFGLREKVVTGNSSYIVLEKVEDYIKYNISPPKDLEEECQKLNYVKKDTKSYRQKLKEQDEFDIMNGVVDLYNEKIKQWNKYAEPVQLSRTEFENYKVANFQNGNDGVINPDQLTGKSPGLSVGIRGSSSSLNEVVVTGYGSAMRRDLTGSVSYVTPNQILPGLTIEQNLQGRVAGLNVFPAGNFINPSEISIRGSSALGNQPLYVIDGMTVNDNPNNYININDIENITVLKDAAASAIYGSKAANGVIIINSKKPRMYGYRSYSNKPYRLKDMEDVAYMEELKSAAFIEKLPVYYQLRNEHGNEAGYYFDVAQYFFEIGMKQEAMQILMNAAEISNGDLFALKAIGYVLENWKYIDQAVKLYEQLLQSNPFDLYLYRDLAWAYYQAGNFQKAVDLLYKAIKLNLSYQEDWDRFFKAILLSDMNAIIAVQKDKLDISPIPAALVKPMPVDLKIIVEGNKKDVYNMTIIEPGGTECSESKPVSKNRGYINKSYGRYYYNNPVEYEIKNAVKGKYKIQVSYYDYYQYSKHIPSFIRIITFRNFGKPGQSIQVENVIVDNQYGTIEIGEVEW